MIGDLATIHRKLWARAFRLAYEDVADEVGDVDLDLESPRMRKVYQDIARRIKGIEDETAERVRGYVKRGQDEGLSPQELAQLIRSDPSGAFGAARAKMIARSESAVAYNRGSILGYRDSGRVTRVRVYDGNGCPWPEGEHGSGPDANGMVVDLDEAERYPTGHPHCRRAFSAVVER